MCVAALKCSGTCSCGAAPIIRCCCGGGGEGCAGADAAAAFAAAVDFVALGFEAGGAAEVFGASFWAEGAVAGPGVRED